MTLKKIPPRKDAHLEWQRFTRARVRSVDAAQGGEGEREGGDAPSSLSNTHPLFSFAELAAQGNISNRQAYCLTGDRVKNNHKKTSQAGQLSREEIGFTHLQLTCPLVLRLNSVYINSPMICGLVAEDSRLAVPFPGPKAPVH